MRLTELLGQFGDTYDGQKMRRLVEILERVLGGTTAPQDATVSAVSYPVDAGVNTVLVGHTTTAAVGIFLPPAASRRGQTVTVKDSGGNASVNTITVQRSGSDTIDGATTAVINTNYGVLRVYSNGVAWYTV